MGFSILKRKHKLIGNNKFTQLSFEGFLLATNHPDELSPCPKLCTLPSHG